MPYSRTTRKRRTRRGRKSYRKPRMTTGRVKRIIDAELKVRDLGVGPVAMPTVTGSFVHITSIAQGDSNAQRNGNWIRPVTWMGTVTLTANDADAVNNTVQYRIGCILWKENEDINAASLTKIVQDTSAPHQQYNIENKGQFKVLWSRTGILSNDTTNPRFQAVHKFYLRPRMKVLFEGATFKNNHLFLFGYSNVATEADPPTISFDTRIRYTDS